MAMKMTILRWMLSSIAGLFCLWLGLVAYIGWAMRQPPKVFGHVMAHMPPAAYVLFPFESMWTDARNGSIQVGDMAPVFTVNTLKTNMPVQLSSLWAEKPVVLVFGSYTCPPFRREAPALNKLSVEYKDKVNFYSVYIQEAHPTDGWAMQTNVREQVLFRSPRDDAERAAIAGTCVRKLGIQFPAVLDSIDNRVEIAYSAWPDRTYLIAPNGRVLYKSKPGPFGFRPEELATALLKEVGNP
jgi:thiol-disulfide isomerase/thioredoxin